MILQPLSPVSLRVIPALSNGSTTVEQVAYITSHIAAAFTSSFTGSTALDVYNAIYGQLTDANPTFLLADLISSEAVDNKVTVTSVIGNNTFAGPANSGGLDGTITGLLGNTLTCTEGFTHKFYAYTGSKENAPLIINYDCTIQSAIAFMLQCATWSMQPGSDFYGSYDNGSTFVYDGAVLADQAFPACMAGMNHYANIT